ncbi:MAG: gamma-glutamyltransferase family protein [Alphaproteobacteria bacterium]|nr:gamma-glutamyltransferase family protein [Alphaproteobacteria bacterium]
MPTTRPELMGTFGMVATSHYLASAAAMAALEKGGNAFDAAVTAGFVLQVVQPHMCGPAGEAPMILSYRGQTPVRVLAGQGPAPQAATIEAYRTAGFDMIPGTGLMAACVPAAFDSWMLLLAEYGTMGLREVLEPALGYAKNGHPVLPAVAEAIGEIADMFVSEWTSSAAVYLSGGKPPRARSLYAIPALAESYQRIITEAEAAGGNRERQIERARAVWREGFVAEAIDRFCREGEAMDSSGARHGGLLTGDDMAKWQAGFEPPLTYDYHGITLAKCGPWSQGPVMAQQLALLKGFDLGAMDPVGPDFIHTVVECAKLAYADREKFYGDPNFAPVPMHLLLSDEYNDHRRELVGQDASLDLRPGHLPGYGADEILVGTEAGGVVGAGEPGQALEGQMRSDTVHIDCADRFGNMVSATPSGGWLQSSPVVPGLGFPLGSRMQMFWLAEDHPSGLVPGKRPRTTLSPSFALRDGRPWLAFGTPGGDGQDQWPLIMLLRHLHYRLNLQEACDLPQFQSFHFPSSFWPRDAEPGVLALEGGIDEATADELRARGHKVEHLEPWSMGRMMAVAKEGPILKGAASSRFQQIYAVGR